MGLHALAEARSLAFHRAVADRLRKDPELMATARSRVARWESEGGRSAGYAREWGSILERPLAEVLALLVDEGEEARALRQATPFAGVLPPKERWRLWAEVRRQWPGTT